MARLPGIQQWKSFMRPVTPGTILALIIVAAFALRLAAFLYVAPWDPNVFIEKIYTEDAPSYHTNALKVLNTGSFATFDAFRTPGYPLFLAAVYAVAGVKPWLVLFLQLFIGAATAGLVYILTRKLTGSLFAAQLAAGVYAIEPYAIFYSVNLLTETLFVFVFLLAVITLLHALEKSSLPLFAAAGFLIGAVTLIRPIAQFFPAVAVFLILIYAGRLLSLRLKACALCAACFAATIAPWLWLNYSRYGHASLATVSSYNLLYCNRIYTELTASGKTYEQLESEYKATLKERGMDAVSNPFELANAQKALALEYLTAHPAAYAGRHLKGMLNMFINLGTTNLTAMLDLPHMTVQYRYYAFTNYVEMVRWFFRNKTPCEIALGLSLALYLIVAYIAAFAGAARLIREKKYFPLILVATIILYFAALTGLVATSRYRLPVVPFYLVLTGYGAAAFARREVLPAHGGKESA